MARAQGKHREFGINWSVVTCKRTFQWLSQGEVHKQLINLGLQSQGGSSVEVRCVVVRVLEVILFHAQN